MRSRRGTRFANTVGTALPEAIAVLAGKRLGTYDRRMHATFTLMRYIDDVAFSRRRAPASDRRPRRRRHRRSHLPAAGHSSAHRIGKPRAALAGGTGTARTDRTRVSGRRLHDHAAVGSQPSRPRSTCGCSRASGPPLGVGERTIVGGSDRPLPGRRVRCRRQFLERDRQPVQDAGPRRNRRRQARTRGRHTWHLRLAGTRCASAPSKAAGDCRSPRQTAASGSHVLASTHSSRSR